jgi:uncharacterized protein DUF781
MLSVSPASIEQLDFYPVWSQTPALTDTVNPFEFAQRMAIYRLLVEAANRSSIFGAENERNFFWGYVFQLQWQWRSGRLRLAKTPEGQIDADSMWGYGNYTLSVIPLIAAMNVGTVRPVEILPPRADSIFEYVLGGGKAGAVQVPAVLQDAVQIWEAFFKQAAGTKAGSDLEPLLFLFWNAHKQSLNAIEQVRPIVEKQAYARHEINFFMGWIRMVDYLWVAAWPTDLKFMLENGSDVLPERMLREQDIPGHIPDMNDRVNANVRNILNLSNLSDFRFNFNLWLWKRAMRTRQARDEVVAMLDAVFNPSPKNVKERRKLFRYMLGL